MKLHQFSVERFGALRGAKGVFAPRLSVVWTESESGKVSFMRFIRQILSFGNLFGEESRSPTDQSSGCLVLRTDDGRALKAEPGGLQNLTADTENAPGPVAEEIKYLCLAAAAGLETLPFSDFVARADEKERALGAFAEEGRDIPRRIRDNEAEMETLRAIKRNYRASLEELEEKRNAVAWTTGQLKDERRRLRRYCRQGVRCTRGKRRTK